jgi:eukaryotic-like serine/threonine-protein kinase
MVLKATFSSVRGIAFRDAGQAHTSAGAHGFCGRAIVQSLALLMNSQPLALGPGQIFAGQFRVERALAQGGMGAVYVVEQLSTGKKRALKLMLPSATLVDGTRRFEQEARTSSLIPSEHVVDVIGAGIEGPERIPWLAMELLEGETLEDYLNRQGPLGLRNARDIFAQLLHALCAAHDLGIVHRDLKPDNIFLAQSRTADSAFMVKVLDFGLAVLVNAGTRNTTAIGSPLWMAPEQCETDRPITLATDVWPLGLLVFRMLSGRHYWRTVEEGSLPSLMRELLIDELPPASRRGLELGGSAFPPGFDEWFARCVAREPGLRFQHARAAWQALQPLLELDQSKPAPQPSWSQTKTLDVSGAGASGTGALTAFDAPASTRTQNTAFRRSFPGLILLGTVALSVAGWLLSRQNVEHPAAALSGATDRSAHAPAAHASAEQAPSAKQAATAPSALVEPALSATLAPPPVPASSASARGSVPSKPSPLARPRRATPTAPLPAPTSDVRVGKPSPGVPDLL